MMDSREPHSYAEAEQRLQTNAKFSAALRIAMTIVVLIYAGLAYSLCYVSRDSAEYYVALLTLGWNTLLFAAILIAAMTLKKRRQRYVEIMKHYTDQDRADPWRLNQSDRRE